MEIVEFGHLSADQRGELEGDELDPFEASGIKVAGERFPVVGLGGVIVNAAHRGQGLGRAVVDAAIRKAATLGPRFMILFCHADRAGLYRRLGFAEQEPPVRVQQRDGYAEMPMVTMWRALTPGAIWPRGQLTVQGLPF
jgi:predicted N-acetyltransferase YhbS